MQGQLERRAEALARMRQEGDFFGLMSTLRMDYLRQTGAYCSSCLMEAASACPVVPEPVQRYIDEVCESLRHIADCEDMPLEHRQSFLRELRHAYGRTGLVLSGGGSFGFWHFGVVRALLQANLLPRVVSGSSAGSIGGSLLCTRTNEELRDVIDVFYDLEGLDFFRHTSPGHIMRHLVTKGFLQDVEFFQGRLRRLLGDLTFLDAYTRTGTHRAAHAARHRPSSSSQRAGLLLLISRQLHPL
jgi:TAG lipase/steryl ester hydrolase/phospholipase A2/LPA acyltransferase